MPRATQVRALIWEEARVGGLIAGSCAAVAIALLLYSRLLVGELAWERGDFLTRFAGLWVPIIAAVLLVLNPDYSGHLVGGFSKRILRFPVATPLAVAVTLVSRLVILFVTSSAIIGVAGTLFRGAPGISALLVVITLYFIAQFIDWLRGPISGLTSLAATGVAVLIVAWLWPGGEFAPMTTAIEYTRSVPIAYPLALTVGGVAVYVASIFVVGIDRVGLRYGVPELWEWPRRLPLPAAKTRRAFTSPFAAQVWFEVRRSRFLLPLVAFTIFGLAWIAAWWADIARPGSWDSFEQRNLAATLGVATGLFFGAIAHGVQTRVVGFRGAGGKPGYEYLQPLTDAQFALARVAAAMAMLMPTLLVGALLHFLVAGWSFVSDSVPDAYGLGISSAREIAWMFLARILLAAVLALVLVGVGASLFQAAIGAMLVLLVFVLVTDVFLDTDFFDARRDRVLSLVSVTIIATTFTLHVRALRRGWISPRHTMVWLMSWVLFAWLLRYPIVTQWVLETLPLGEQFGSFLSPLAMASVLPLLFVSTLRDVHRRRHPTAQRLDPAGTIATLSRGGRRIIGAASLILAVAILWLGWPSTPRYVEFLRDHGHPASLAELDALYAAPRDAQNPAETLTSLLGQRSRDELEFQGWFRSHGAEILGWEPDPLRSPMAYFHYVYLVGQVPLPQSARLDAAAWRATESYWEHVTAELAPQLRAISQTDLSGARFPVDLTKGYQVELGHLAPVRNLATELQLDALHWVVAGQPDRALDDVEASLQLPDVLLNEPVLISQFLRFGMIGRALDTAGNILNRSVLTDEQLRRLQRLFGDLELEQMDEGLRRGLLFESLAALDFVNRYALVADSYTDRSNDLLELASRLAYPTDAQRAMLLLNMEEVSNLDQPQSEPEVGRWLDSFEQLVVEAHHFIAPTAWNMIPSLAGIWNSEIHAQTRLALLDTAIVVERYRVANGRLPAALSDLVPAFLDEVPVDLYSEAVSPIRYVVRETGEFIVYSVGSDDVDGTLSPRYPEDPGYENHGDIRVTVGPESFRRGPQVESE